jgi:hypothetical protein
VAIYGPSLRQFIENNLFLPTESSCGFGSQIFSKFETKASWWMIGLAKIFSFPILLLLKIIHFLDSASTQLVNGSIFPFSIIARILS